ncbi:MAG: endonuclease/exonuclease/phosphatase family protein [Chitinispirillaceae bacterium]
MTKFLPLVLITLMYTYSTASSKIDISNKSASGSINLGLNVLSFNIRYGTAKDGRNSWSHRREQVIDLLKKQKADIIGLQEGLRFQLDEIRDEMNHYGEIGKGRDDGKHSGEHSAILYKTEKFKVSGSGTFWLSETPSVPGSAHWGNRHPRICSWVKLKDRKTGASFLVYNIHLDHRNSDSRWKSVSLLNQHIKNHSRPGVPVLVMGDFNVGENNSLIKYIKGKEYFQQDKESSRANDFPLKDTFREVHPKAKGGTFHMFWGKNFGPKLDYIFVQPETDIVNARIIRSNMNGKWPSDHFPISADVIFRCTVN